MSYEVKKDEMVGKHVAEFQAELTLAKKLEGIGNRPRMPYGYPTQLYHPYHTVVRPKHTEHQHHEHGKLSNNVPWVLGMDVVGSYTIGVYNPKKGKNRDVD
jgi:hypothetical protein